MGSALVALGTIAACRSINFTGPRDHSNRDLAAPPDLFGVAYDLKPPPGPTDTAINLQRRVDVLFVVDNSPSMTPKQQALKAAFGNVATALNTARDAGRLGQYHIGVITSDLGANMFVDSLMSCKEGGLGGALQPIGAAAPSECLPPTGTRKFIEIDQIAGTSNLPAAPAAADPLTWTFGCMSAVGDKGCGFEQTLESARVALSDSTIAANAGFLREEATLIVVFVTDEDDCSTPTTSSLFDPMQMNPPPDGLGRMSSYRCSNFGIVCTNPATGMPTRLPYEATGGVWTNCRSATNAEGGLLYESSRYIDFFTKPRAEGGVKPSGVRVALFGILGDSSAGLEVVVGGQQMTSDGQPQPCTGPGCSPILKHACVIEPSNHGDPAVRLREVIQAAPTSALSSVCSDFGTTLTALGSLMVAEVGTGCLDRAIATPSAPSCKVEEVTYNGAAAPTKTTLPKCDATNSNTPCWVLETHSGCAAIHSPVSGADEQLRLRLERGATPQPEGTGVAATCVTVAAP